MRICGAYEKGFVNSPGDMVFWLDCSSAALSAVALPERPLVQTSWFRHKVAQPQQGLRLYDWNLLRGLTVIVIGGH